MSKNVTSAILIFFVLLPCPCYWTVKTMNLTINFEICHILRKMLNFPLYSSNSFFLMLKSFSREKQNTFVSVSFLRKGWGLVLGHDRIIILLTHFLTSITCYS